MSDFDHPREEQPILIRGDIRTDIADYLDIADIESLPFASFDQLVDAFNSQTIDILVHPGLDRDELDKELSLPERITFRLIRNIPFLVIVITGLLTIYWDNYWWLALLPTYLVLDFFRSFLIRFRLIIYPGLFIWLLTSTFVYNSFTQSLLATMVLLMALYFHQTEVFIHNRLLKRVLHSQEYFIYSYLRNWILVTDGDHVLNSHSETDYLIDHVDESNPLLLTEQDRLFYCKICSKKSFSKQYGIVCGLTSEKPVFEYECPDLEVDSTATEATINKLYRRIEHLEEAKDSVQAGPLFLNIIASLFIISDFYFFTHGDFIDIINSGMSAWLAETDRYVYAYSLILPMALYIISTLADMGLKRAYLAAMVLYGTDAFASIFYTSNWTWYLHLIGLGILLKSFQDIGAFKVFEKGLPRTGLNVRPPNSGNDKMPEHPQEHP